MTTLIDIENAVRSWCEAVSGRPTYKEPLNRAMPAGDFCTVHVAEDQAEEMTPVTLAEDGLNETVTGRTRLVIDVVALRGDAGAVASRLRRSLSASARYTDLWPLMGYGSADPVRDLSAIQSANVQPRNEFRWYAFAAINEEFAADYFDRTEIDGTVIGIDNPPPAQDTTGCD